MARWQESVPGVVYRESRRRLAPGDVIVAFTDGVTEAMDTGPASSRRSGRPTPSGPATPMSPAAVVDRLVTAVEAFTGQAEQADDITILALQFRPSPPLAAVRTRISCRSRP